MSTRCRKSEVEEMGMGWGDFFAGGGSIGRGCLIGCDGLGRKVVSLVDFLMKLSGIETKKRYRKGVESSFNSLRKKKLETGISGRENQ
jgi:hypothetical protein